MLHTARLPYFFNHAHPLPLLFQQKRLRQNAAVRFHCSYLYHVLFFSFKKILQVIYLVTITAFYPCRSSDLRIFVSNLLPKGLITPQWQSAFRKYDSETPRLQRRVRAGFSPTSLLASGFTR